MEYFRPHPGATFEGYYNKFILPSGASVILIICTVPKADDRPHMVSFTHIPCDNGKILQREIWADHLSLSLSSNGDSFYLNAPPFLSMTVHTASEVSYSFILEEGIIFRAKTSGPHVPWSSKCSTPEGFLAFLPLPLHWYVHSLASPCTFSLTLPPSHASQSENGTTLLHQEKNWATSFPTAHVWLCARDAKKGAARSFCAAGGKILGVEAFLAGYRNVELGLELDFRPPLALRVLGVSPFMAFDRDWDARRLRLVMRGWAWKIEVRARAPEGTFFSLAAPWPRGHRENWMSQSLRAELEVSVWNWRWGWPWGSWKLIKRHVFERAAMEFGGEYYPMRGTENKFN